VVKDSAVLQLYLDPKFAFSLGYLANVSGIPNSLNFSLQGTDVTILEAKEKVVSFQGNLALCERRVKSGNFANFPFFYEIASDLVPPVEPRSL
jgi:hypothetical protein